MKKIIALGCATALLTGITGVTAVSGASAEAAPGVSAQSTGSVRTVWHPSYKYLYSGCYSYPVVTKVVVPAEADSWEVEVTLTDPDGGTSTDYDFQSTTGADTVKSSFYLCSGWDPAGKYELDARLTWTDYDADYGDGDVVVDAATKHVRLPKAWTKTTFSVSPKRPKYTKSMTLTAKSITPKPAGRKAVSWPKVKFQQHRNGAWRTVTTGYGNASGVTKESFQWLIRPGKSTLVRVVTNTSDDYNRSVSRVKRVRTR